MSSPGSVCVVHVLPQLQVARLESKPVPASLSPTMGGFCRAAFVGEELGRSLQREGVPGEA